jgi:hypothetical protein
MQSAINSSLVQVEFRACLESLEQEAKCNTFFQSEAFEDF